MRSTVAARLRAATWLRATVGPPLAAGALAAGLLTAGALAPALTTSASAYPNFGTGLPLAAIARTAGNVEVYWRGADGFLYEKAQSGGTWGSPVRTPIDGLASAPTATVGPHGYDYVFWQGTDGYLWEAAATPQGWTAATKLGVMGPLGSQPAAASIQNASGISELDVFWKGTGTAGNLWRAEYLTSTGKWAGPSEIGMGPLATAPTATEEQTSAGPQIQVFWKGTAGDLREAHTSGGTTWSGPTSLGMGPLGSAPAAASLSYGREIAFWAGTAGRLWQASWDSGTWNGAQLTGPTSVGFGPMSSAPTVAAQQTDGWDVFWIGADSTLWEATESGGAWTSEQSLGSMTPPGAPPAPTTTPVTTTPAVPTTPTTSTTPKTKKVTVRPPKRARKQIRVTIKLDWKWHGRRTRLHSIRFGRLPKHGRISVACTGRHCMRPTSAAGHRRQLKLTHKLEHRVFHAGQKLWITISAAERKPENIKIKIRDGKAPLASILH